MIMRVLTVLLFLIVSASADKEKGRKPIILHRLLGTVPVELWEGDKVGVMLINDGDEKNPSPRFIVALAATRTVLDTKDLDLFRSVLSRLPRGTSIIEYDSCTIPRSWGLTEQHYEAYCDVFDDLGLKFSEERRITCTCDATTRPVKRAGKGRSPSSKQPDANGDQKTKP